MVTQDDGPKDHLLRITAQLSDMEQQARASGHFVLAHLLHAARAEAEGELGAVVVLRASAVRTAPRLPGVPGKNAPKSA